MSASSTNNHQLKPPNAHFLPLSLLLLYSGGFFLRATLFLNSQHFPRSYLLFLSFCCVPRLRLLPCCSSAEPSRPAGVDSVVLFWRPTIHMQSLSLSLGLSTLQGISIHRYDPKFKKLSMPKILHHSFFSPSRSGTLFTHPVA